MKMFCFLICQIFGSQEPTSGSLDARLGGIIDKVQMIAEDRDKVLEIIVKDAFHFSSSKAREAFQIFQREISQIASGETTGLTDRIDQIIDRLKAIQKVVEGCIQIGTEGREEKRKWILQEVPRLKGDLLFNYKKAPMGFAGKVVISYDHNTMEMDRSTNITTVQDIRKAIREEKVSDGKYWKIKDLGGIVNFSRPEKVAIRIYTLSTSPNIELYVQFLFQKEAEVDENIDSWEIFEAGKVVLRKNDGVQNKKIEPINE